MARPGDRPLHVLPVLGEHKDSLEKCAYCPKLCRSACPVSNAEPRETLTPWGKMSTAYFVARGDVPANESFAAPAWACTGCRACRDTCDHKNEVGKVLLAARSGLLEKGLAPEGAKRAIAKFAEHAEKTRKATRELCDENAVRSDSKDALLVGCGYVRGATPEARDAVRAASALVRGPVALIEECCGLPLLQAGDAKGFARRAEQLARATKRFDRVLVHDAGCAIALRGKYKEIGAEISAKIELLVEVAAREIESLSTVRDVNERVRYHDPCQLGRGLGIYEAPRAILTRALGRAPEEFDDRREKGACSGGGGLLPMTMPETSREIAKTRVASHERSGGGRVVTACASSLRALRNASESPVDDIVTWIARSARPWRPLG